MKVMDIYSAPGTTVYFLNKMDMTLSERKPQKPSQKGKHLQ